MGGEMISYFHFLQSYKPSILMLTAVNINTTLTLAHVKTPQQCTMQELCVTHDFAHLTVKIRCTLPTMSVTSDVS